MSDDHKAALADGRNQSRAVRRYLEALEAHKPRRGRKRSPESIQNRLDKIEADLAGVGPLKRVRLIQERLDLTAELGSSAVVVDLTALEQGFIGVAAAYSSRKGISYDAWREFGIEPAVLKRAGITRLSRPRFSSSGGE